MTNGLQNEYFLKHFVKLRYNNANLSKTLKSGASEEEHERKEERDSFFSERVKFL